MKSNSWQSGRVQSCTVTETHPDCTLCEETRFSQILVYKNVIKEKFFGRRYGRCYLLGLTWKEWGYRRKIFWAAMCGMLYLYSI